MFSRAGYALKQTFSQIWRNKSMYLVSVLAITAMMLILGIFFISFVSLLSLLPPAQAVSASASIKNAESKTVIVFFIIISSFL